MPPPVECSPVCPEESEDVFRNPALLAARGRTDGPNVQRDATSRRILFHKLARELAPQRGRSDPHKANESPQAARTLAPSHIYKGYK